MLEIRRVLGEIPILASEQKLLDEAGGNFSGGDEILDEEGGESKEKEKVAAAKPKVLADGTYATETAFTSGAVARLEAVKSASKPPLRSESKWPSLFILIFSCQ